MSSIHLPHAGRGLRWALPLLFALPLILSLRAGDNTDARKAYVKRYAAMAVSEMYRSGVPASITLAQGILESDAGRSRLSTQGNNHFGIKCHNWKGKSMLADDEKKDECFRVYDSPLASFQDHSDFLRYWDRYKFLFELETTDYKGWANGLKKAGYASAPTYASSLIKLIEDYDLSRFDTMTVLEAEKETGLSAEEVAEQNAKATGKGKGKKSRKGKKPGLFERLFSKKGKAAAADTLEQSDPVFIDERPRRIPRSPLSLEEPEKLEKSGETFVFSLSRPVYTMNGVPFIYSVKGETLRSIADANNLFLREIRNYNDVPASFGNDTPLPAGTLVYLQSKKSFAPADLEKFIVDNDETTLRDIAQRYGVRLEALCKMNDMSSDQVLREGDTIVLRGPSMAQSLLDKIFNRNV